MASNWKKAAKHSIFGKTDKRPTSPGREDFGGGRDLHEFEDESDAIWRNPGMPTVLRGKTAGDRREMTFAADGNMMCKSYSGV